MEATQQTRAERLNSHPDQTFSKAFSSCYMMTAPRQKKGKGAENYF